MAFDVQGARKAGYTEDEIAGYLAKETKFDLDGAKKAGYSTAEIVGHLAKPVSKVDADAKRFVKSTPAAVRAFTQGVTLGGADEMDAALAYAQTGIGNAVKRATGRKPDYTAKQAYDAVQRVESADDRRFASERPVTSGALNLTGAVLTPGMGAVGNFVTKGAPALAGAGGVVGALAGKGVPAMLARGALTGAATGGIAGAAMSSPGERAQGAGRGALSGGVIGTAGAGITGALAGRSGQAARVPTPQQRNVSILDDAQVFMTPGTRMGGAVKQAEDLAKRAPILGAAIKGAAGRSTESLNRAVADQALNPIGAYLPKEVATGHDTVKHVAETIGKVYDEAAALVPQAQLDDVYKAAAQQIASRLDEQPAGVKAQFEATLKNRLKHLEGKSVTGKQIRDAQSDISRMASEFSSSSDSGQRALGGALDDLSDELANIIGRNNPQAAEMIDKANQGWSIYTRIRNAASKAKGGIYTPGQLATAVRSLDRSVGKGSVAKGEAVLQDLSNAAWEVLPDGYGNPGTADALSAMTLAGSMAAPQTAPVAIPAAGVLAAAATPYMMMGRKVVERLPSKPTPAQARAAAQELRALAVKDPRVAVLLKELGDRFPSAVNEQVQRSMTPGISVQVPALGVSYN